MRRRIRLLAGLAVFVLLAFLGFIIFFADTGTMPTVIHHLEKIKSFSFVFFVFLY